MYSVEHRLHSMGRFSTGKGQQVAISKLPHFFLSLGQTIIRKTTGRIPRQPWIPFEAAQAINQVASSTWRVWEIGSGYSTLWLSDRVAHVVSVEASKDWHELLMSRIEHEGISNVDLRFEWRGNAMASFAEIDDGTLDLLFIDGGPRGDCLVNGFSKVKSGGYIYLDNWDNDAFWRQSDREFVEQHSSMLESVREYIDYVPAQVGVYAGLLIKKA